MLRTIAAATLFAGLIVTISSTYAPADAAAACGLRCAPPPTTGGGPETGGGPSGGTGGDGGDLPALTPTEQISKIEEACNGGLHQLVKIPVTMVESFSNESGVVVAPVCNSGLGRKASIDNSQALPLQPAIAANPALNGPLAKDGFGPDNVVGVVLKDGVATLYVHKGGLTTVARTAP